MLPILEPVLGLVGAVLGAALSPVVSDAVRAWLNRRRRARALVGSPDASAAHGGTHNPAVEHETAQRTSTLRRILAPVIGALVGASVVLVGISYVRPCFAQFDFNGGSEGWIIRDENNVRLGRSLTTADSEHAGRCFDHRSLALTFELGPPPLDRAQIGVEGVNLESEIAASVKVPDNLPSTMTASAFVLEHNVGIPGRPEWLFYQTQPRALDNRGWNDVSFSKREFQIVGSYPVAMPVGTYWRNPPLMVGFEIRDSTQGSVSGLIYFDEIRVR